MEVVMLTRVLTGLALAALTCAAANAQSVRPPSSIEILAGHAGFADDATIEHSVFGGAGRVYLTPRISVGPEITYMRGPGDDRDWFFLGNLIVDVRSPTAGRPPRVSPFVIAGAGFFTHSDRVGTGIYTSSEGTFAAGAGASVHVTDRVYVMGDLRFGWEWHYRLSGGIGISM
jgi:outer membrane protein with beta-barrel domain